MFDSLSDSMREAFDPQTPPAAIVFNKVPYITLSLVAINCVVFVIMTTHDLWASAPSDGPSAGEFLRWGANFGPLTLSGQWWRLVTACFVHSGVPHLLGNMVVLLLAGWRAERLFGSIRFGLFYLLAGVGGNIAGLYFHQFTVSEGASGAIFGIYGGLFAFLLRQRGAVSSDGATNIGRSAATFVVYSLILSLGKMGIDIEAHIVGLITGFVAGLFLARPVVQGQPRKHGIRAAGVAGGGIALAVIALFLVPKASASRTGWYQQVVAGKRIKSGPRDALVFSGSVTRSEAQTMAEAMTRAGMFSDPGIVIVFDRSASSGSLSMALRGDETLSATFDDVSSTLVDVKTVITHTTKARKPLPWNDPQLLGALKTVGPQLAAAGGGLPFRIRLLNSDGELRNEVNIETTEVVSGRHDRVSYSGRSTASDAAALGEALQKCGFFKDLGSLIYLKNEGHGPEISFLMSDGSWNDPRAVAYLHEVARKVAVSAGGPPLRVRLMNKNREVENEFMVE